MAKNKTVEQATFGAGCFWCVEYEFSKLDGVIEVVSGFSGGNVENPDYYDVVKGKTGHAEVAHITFDPQKILYNDLLNVFWAVHDPTQLNRQGVDVGEQYRSIILYHSAAQKVAAEKSLDALQKTPPYKNRKIVTQIQQFDDFYPAEEGHQDYYAKHPEKAKRYEQYKKSRGLGK